ncbi:PREDICTED: uncharacterized protein LOC106108326 isoform X2 [Papilio polytes]|uniref:uncharacterized protein LOC106108326 isoform X2 n=1 Tax=Papilio polytes TaxID=76194 RepID=UPI000675ECA2|nr:PREDICTED: uncharacterized protein LOC106108326 isoform X2 [Papilio polytes]
MANEDFLYLGMSRFSALNTNNNNNNTTARRSLVSCLIQFNNDVGRRLRTRCTISRSTSNSPIKNNIQRRPCSPWYGNANSPPLCNSPTRYPTRLYSRSRNDLGDGLSDSFAQEPTQPEAYFSTKPPSEPVQVIIEPRIMNDLDYKFNSSTSYESRCLDEFNITPSMTIAAEIPPSDNSLAVVRRILSSLLSTLPLVDPPSDAFTYRYISQYYDNKSMVRSEPEQRSVAVQVAQSSMTVSVGNCSDYWDRKGNRQKNELSKKRWMGSMRALRESHLRLMMRQIRQLRQIERLDRSLKRVCSVRVSCDNDLT